MLPNHPDFNLLYTFFELGMIFHVVATALLLLLTKNFLQRAVKRNTHFKKTTHPQTVPIMLPIGAVTKHTEKSVRSLLEQEYENYRVILISETDKEEAAVLIRKLCAEYDHVSHIVAGPSERCSQKNHNLLAAIATIQPDENILVFCDSTHLARPDFLARLILPIITGETKLTSGYRFIQPEDNRMGTIIQMIAVMSLHMLYALKPISQPWGGATAIDRSTFFKNRIPDLWSRTVVDDYSMGPYLKSLGIHSLPVAEACLETQLSGQTVSGVSNWFYRQLQFFKFYTPLTWIAASVLPLFYLCMVTYIATALIIPSTPTARLTALLYLGTMTILGLWFTQIIPNELPRPKRIAAFFIFNILASVQLLRTWTSNTISWQSIDYHMSLGGGIIRTIRHNSRTQ